MYSNVFNRILHYMLRMKKLKRNLFDLFCGSEVKSPFFPPPGGVEMTQSTESVPHFLILDSHHCSPYYTNILHIFFDIFLHIVLLIFFHIFLILDSPHTALHTIPTSLGINILGYIKTKTFPAAILLKVK